MTTKLQITFQARNLDEHGGRDWNIESNILTAIDDPQATPETDALEHKLAMKISDFIYEILDELAKKVTK